MKLAADRDMIARQYANGFADVFDFGVPAFLDGVRAVRVRRGGDHRLATPLAGRVPRFAHRPQEWPGGRGGCATRAAEVLKLGGIATPEGRRAGVALDKHLRSDGNKLNPGTTADLITACLFVALAGE